MFLLFIFRGLRVNGTGGVRKRNRSSLFFHSMILGAEIQKFYFMGIRYFRTILCLYICFLYVFYIGIN
jgi:hypothetical protein